MTANLSTAAEPESRTVVEARDLHLSFGSTRALRGAWLTVRQGEIVAVMGPSGSGKSTLLHCLTGILVPDEGEVWFCGQRLDTLSDDRRSALRHGIAGQVSLRSAQVNGYLALIIELDGEIDTVVTVGVDDGLITRLYAIRNPEKLSHVDRETALHR